MAWLELIFDTVVSIVDETIRHHVHMNDYPESVKQDYGGFVLHSWLTQNASITVSPRLHALFVYDGETDV